MNNLELWAWGANNYGQLGNGQPCEQVESPLRLEMDDLDENTQIVLGGGHTFCLTSNRLYVTGWNHKGQCGLGTTDTTVTEFSRVNTPEDFVQVAAGWDFSFGLDKNGYVYSCGSNTFGQIGLSNVVKTTTEFQLIKGLSNIKAISCGMRHAIFLSNDGNIFVCGSGKKGQLCIQPSKENTFKATEVDFEEKKVIDIKVGQNFTLLMFDDGNANAFGDDKHGQITNLSKIFSENHPSQIEVGWTHIVALYNNGTLKSIGRGDYGQTSVATLKDVQKISVGYEHGLALDCSKQLYSWGWNEHGNCGVGHTKNVFHPCKIDLKGRNVIECYAGSGHSFALAKATS